MRAKETLTELSFLSFPLTPRSLPSQEFHQFLGLKPSRFSERIFGILDLDESGALEFNEFVIGIWNFCTYDALLITKVRGRQGWSEAKRNQKYYAAFLHNLCLPA